METSDWKIITCPHCHHLVKVAAHLVTSRLVCPTCQETISLHVHHPTKPDQTSKAALPTTRSFDPEPVKLRGHERESWETRAPDLRQIDFKDKLAKTTDHNGSQELLNPIRRRRSHSQQKQQASWDEDSAPTRRRHHRGRWRLLVRTIRRFWALLLLILLAFGGIVYRFSEVNTHPGDSGYVRTPAPDPVTIKERDVLELQNKAEVLQALTPALKTFLNAQSPAELHPLIRDPQRVIPLLDAYYQQQKPFAPADYRELPTAEGVLIHKQFVVLTMETKAFMPLHITLEKGPLGYLVDWESYVGYGEMSFEKFRARRPTSPTLMRCKIRVVEYYNLDFPDSTTHQSYELTPVDDSEAIYGYIARTSPLIGKITTAQLGVPSFPCVLRLCYPPNTTEDHRQVEIAEYVQTGYVIRGEDFPLPSEPSLPKDAAPGSPGQK